MPILHFTKGERFFPMHVEDYVQQSRLMRVPQDDSESVVLQKNVAIEALNAKLPNGAYLEFVSKDDLRKARLKPLHVKRTSSKSHRLTYVGLAGRVADTVFRSANIFRSLVPAGVSDAAAMKVRQHTVDKQPVVYGRMVEDDSWVVLQYYYFYAMNDWRSHFAGVNDHESDWEQVLIYLDKKSLSPAWLAYATHDHHGDDLRRSWHDDEVKKEGLRPVVYVGAGSHASYFSKGEYLMSIHLSFTKLFTTIQRRLRRMARLPYDQSGFELPFIDLAHGNGRKTVEKDDFKLVEIDKSMRWVHDYRGLWGLDTRDNADGERAPAGPKFNRDGSIRASWADPVGWAGLHKIDTASELDERGRVKKIDTYVDASIAELLQEIDLLNTARTPESIAQIAAIEKKITELKQMQVALKDSETVRSRESADSHSRAHLKNPAIPLEEDLPSRRLFLNAWALVSAPVVFALLSIASIYPADDRWRFLFFGAVTILVIELFAKRNLVRYLILYAYIFVVLVLLAMLANIVVAEFFVGFAAVFGLLTLVSLYWNIKDRITLR